MEYIIKKLVEILYVESLVPFIVAFLGAIKELVKNLDIEFFVPFIAAFLGAFSSSLLALWREKKQRVSQRTQDIMDRFFSREFIEHRASLWKMREQVRSKAVYISFIAAGYVYPIEGNYYHGSKVNGLTEHEHLTLYLGFVNLLGLAIKQKEVNVKHIVDAFSYEFIWHADLIRSVATVAGEMASKKTKPSFVENVHEVLNVLKLHKEYDEIGQEHFYPNNYEKKAG